MRAIGSRSNAPPTAAARGQAGHLRHRADACPKPATAISRPAQATADGVHAVERFVEKPDQAKAQEMLRCRRLPVEFGHVHDRRHSVPGRMREAWRPKPIAAATAAIKKATDRPRFHSHRRRKLCPGAQYLGRFRHFRKDRPRPRSCRSASPGPIWAAGTPSGRPAPRTPADNVVHRRRHPQRRITDSLVVIGHGPCGASMAWTISPSSPAPTPSMSAGCRRRRRSAPWSRRCAGGPKPSA